MAAITAPKSSFLRRLRRRSSAVAGGIILLAIVVMASMAWWLFPDDPLDMAGSPFLRPFEDEMFPLGTDMLGRDILAGIFHGARVSLLIGCVATIGAMLIGVAIGSVSGYYGGRVDKILMRITELFQTIPQFILALTIVAILQPSLTSTVIALGLSSWPALARLVRAEVLKLRSSEMVQASIMLGAGDRYIIMRHILPNSMAPIIVSASIMVATAILTESGLAFLGLGDPNIVSWGGMIGAGREVLRTDWYIATLPGLAIMLTVLGLNLLGDGINDALNPKQA